VAAAAPPLDEEWLWLAEPLPRAGLVANVATVMAGSVAAAAAVAALWQRWSSAVRACGDM
jgi:hypothetical protein